MQITDHGRPYPIFCTIPGCNRPAKDKLCGIHRPKRKYIVNMTHCEYPSCTRRTKNKFCYNHKPESFERRRLWAAKIRKEKKELMGDISWRSEYDPSISDVSGWEEETLSEYSTDPSPPGDGSEHPVFVEHGRVAWESHAPPMINIDL